MSRKWQHGQVLLYLWIAKRILWLSKKARVIAQWGHGQVDKWIAKADECFDKYKEVSE